MKEKLIIRNFGPIKNVELELGKFNVLIGENATGKSTVAKILSACRYFSFIVGHKSRFIEGLVTYWGFEYNFFKPNFTFISYECDNYLFEYNTEQVKLTSKTESFSKLLKDLDDLNLNYRLTKDTSDKYWNIPHSFFRNQQLKDLMDNPLYIPAERGLVSVFALGQKTVENLSESLYDELDKLTNTISKKFTSRIWLPLINTTYVNINGVGYIGIDNDSNSIRVSSSATGFQSSVPILLALEYYRNISKTFVIEEVELNLFPTIQKRLVENLLEHFNNGKGYKYFLTTHSPYILTSLNNFMYAYQVGKDHKEEINKVIDEKYWLNPDEVSAYLLRYDDEVKGVVQEDILDREEGMIFAEKIDGVSRTLNEKFDSLIDINFPEK